MRNKLRLLSRRWGARLFVGMCCLLWGGFVVNAAEIEEVEGYYLSGEYVKCLKGAKEEIDDGAYSPVWRYLRVKSLVATGAYEQALLELKEVIRRYPSSVRSQMLAYKVYRLNGQTGEAMGALAQVNRMGGTYQMAFWDAEELVALGDAALELGAEPKLVLKGFYERAKQLDPDCREAYLAIGELALSKQDYKLAGEVYGEALKKFGEDARVHFGLGRAFMPSNRERAGMEIEATLVANPKHTGAMLLTANHLIDAEDYEGAELQLARALEVNGELWEAWAMRAVLAFLDNDMEGMEAARERGLVHWSLNPGVDHVIGKKLSQKYRFKEGAMRQRRALAYDGDYAEAKIQLAHDLLRLGQDEEGWTLAEAVSKADGYNVDAYNLVNLQANVKKHVVLKAGDIEVRMSKLEAEVYGERVLDLLTRCKEALTEKYGLKLRNTIKVELFDNAQDFAVRTFGMPGVGAGYLGVCFGDVITANSPSAQQGANWEAVLWHEFAHVVTLNMTGNQMPRWLSEGISVYEEMEEDGTWGQRMNGTYREMILGGELTAVSELSGAFLNPKSQMHMQFAYFESSLVVRYLVENYGLESLKNVLNDLNDGIDVYDAIRNWVGTMDEVEEGFAEYAVGLAEGLAAGLDWGHPEEDGVEMRDERAVVAWVKDHPDGWFGLNYWVSNAIEAKDWERAKGHLERLIALHPDEVEPGNAYVMLAKVHRELDEVDEERMVLERLASLSSDALDTYERLMELAVEREDWGGAVAYGEKYLAVNPMLGRVHGDLGEAYEGMGEVGEAASSYRRLIALGAMDVAGAHYELARLLVGRDDAGAMRHVLESLAEAPRYRDAHKLLLEISRNWGSGTGDGADNKGVGDGKEVRSR